MRSRFRYDTLGRQIGQTDYEANGTTIAYSRTATFNNKSQLVSDYTSTKKSDGATYQSSTTYDYGFGTAYALGSALSVTSVNSKNYDNAAAPDTLTTNSYVWWDGAVQSQIAHKPNSAQATTYYTTFNYNGLGQLSSVRVADGRARTVAFRLNAEGQIIRRDERADAPTTNGDPHEVWYRFNGRQLGYTGNNGTSDVSTAASISERGQATPTTPGAFRNGATVGASYADFANSYDPINSYSQGASGGSYTVRAGDTLQGIAQQIWGDSSLWYKLAEANGLTGAASLTEGTTLILPGGVVKSAYNAGTVKPYDPAEAIGDVTPSTPQPNAPKKNKCGVFGQILLAIISIAVTIVLTPVIGPVGAAIAGNVVSQGVGVATGIQEKFSFKSLAMTAITAGVAQGLDKLGMVVDVGNKIASAAINGVISSSISQGIAVATGLQKKFDWVGVAAAGVGAAAGAGIGGALHFQSGLKGFNLGNTLKGLASGMAADIANAATRSALEGSDFGDNVIAGLPDTLAQFAVSLAKGAIEQPAIERQADQAVDKTFGADATADQRKTAVWLAQCGLSGPRLQAALYLVASIAPSGADPFVPTAPKRKDGTLGAEWQRLGTAEARRTSSNPQVLAAQTLIDKYFPYLDAIDVKGKDDHGLKGDMGNLYPASAIVRYQIKALVENFVIPDDLDAGTDFTRRKTLIGQLNSAAGLGLRIRQKLAYDELVRHGVNRFAAIGYVANGTVESQLDPGKLQDPGKGRGLWQLTDYSRVRFYNSWSGNHGVRLDDPRLRTDGELSRQSFYDQIAYIPYEGTHAIPLQKGYDRSLVNLFDKVQGATSLEDTVWPILDTFENPREKINNLKGRMKVANELQARWGVK